MEFYIGLLIVYRVARGRAVAIIRQRLLENGAVVSALYFEPPPQSSNKLISCTKAYFIATIGLRIRKIFTFKNKNIILLRLLPPYMDIAHTIYRLISTLTSYFHHPSSIVTVHHLLQKKKDSLLKIHCHHQTGPLESICTSILNYQHHVRQIL